MHEFVPDEVIVNGTPVKRDDMVAEFREHLTAMPDLHWEVKDLLVEGDRIAARLLDTTASAEFAETAFYQVQDGRFKVMWYLMDVDSLKSQLA